MKVFYNKADIVFQDCEISPFPSNVHANFSQLSELDPSLKSKMYLTHYPDCVSLGIKPNNINSPFKFYHENEGKKIEGFNWDDCAIENGFKRFVKLGEVFEI
jgi:hypothetical protein